MKSPSTFESTELPQAGPQTNRTRLLLLLCGLTGCSGSPAVSNKAPMSEPKSMVRSGVSLVMPTVARQFEHQLKVSSKPEPLPEVAPVPVHRNCSEDMVDVKGEYCVDRYENHIVDKAEGRMLSPYYTPHYREGYKQRRRWFFKQGKTNRKMDLMLRIPDAEEWQFAQSYELVARSEPGKTPSGYITKAQAVEACDNAGKRLCTTEEWITACRGEEDTLHPYGDRFQIGQCNIHNPYHPSMVITGNAGSNHDDPRLNALTYKNKPLLMLTGSVPTCASKWGDDYIFDMEGNLSEWIASSGRGFRGGAYFRSGKYGCSMSHGEHSKGYYDYSIGLRCCSDTEPKPNK